VKRMTIAAIMLGLLVGLVGTAGARTSHRHAGVKRVYRDCRRDGRLDGHYNPRLLRRALREMPTDLADYSSCPRAIRRVLAAGERRERRAINHVYRQCAQGRVRDGFSRPVLRRALREMPTDLHDYSSCPDAIRAALKRMHHHHRTHR
jgi:hypothetical protein